MFRFSHFAAPAVLSVAVLIGAGGCAPDRHADIPPTATEIGEGRESVFYNAPQDGTVYVYNATSGEMVYSGKLEQGQMVKVDAKENKVLIDETTAVEKDLIDSHRYKIYFERDRNGGSSRSGARTGGRGDQTTVTTPGDSRTTITTDPKSNKTTNTTDQPDRPRR